MRILYVVQRYGTDVIGGSESFCRAFATRMAGRGHDVEVLTSCARSYLSWENEYEPGTAVDDGVVVHRLLASATRDPVIFPLLNELAVAHPEEQRVGLAWLRAQGPLLPGIDAWLDANLDRFDVVVGCTYLYFPTAMAMVRAAGRRPTLFHPTAHDEPQLRLRIFDQVFAAADGFGFLTHEEDDLVRRRFGVRAPGLVHGIGVDLDPPVDEAALRARGGLPDVPYLVYVGRVDPAKGVGEAMSAVRRHRRAHGPELELVVVGEPTGAFGPEPGIRFTGVLPEAERNAAVARALALVMPSRFESFSMALTEAWALGKAAVVYGGCEPLLGQALRSDGALPYHDEDDLLGVVAYLLARPEAADALGASGRAYVAREYAWDALLARYEEFLTGLARLHRAAA